MSKSGVYPATPLEVVVTTEQEQHQQRQTLLTAVPPSYDQAIGVQPTATAPSVVVVTQPMPSAYGPDPMDVVCPHCHNYTRTFISYRPTSRTHLTALLLCLLQLYPCAVLPYCIDSCMLPNHYCGLCNQYLGTYNRP